MSPRLKKTLLTILGILFLVFGVLGLALPFLQGVLFIAVGIILLSIVSKRFAVYIESHTRKFPSLHAIIVKMENRIACFIGEERSEGTR